MHVSVLGLPYLACPSYLLAKHGINANADPCYAYFTSKPGKQSREKYAHMSASHIKKAKASESKAKAKQ